MNERIRKPKPSKKLKALKLFLISLVFAFVALIVAIIGCNYIANRNFTEKFYSVSSLKVNNKIRIIQISDLHSCNYGKENSKLIERVEKLKPDIIIYTGDMVDADAGSFENVVTLCKTLSSVAPSYYIYGNNEVERYYDIPLTQVALDKKFGFDEETREPSKLLEITDDLVTELENAGVKVLKNSAETLTVGTTEVEVYGVLTSNPSSFWSYAGESFDDFIYNNQNRLKITAIHEPRVFSEYAPDSWGDLMLAGDSHGGLVRVPMLGPLYAKGAGFFPEKSGYYAYGRHEVQGRPLIISSGLENKNPLRINNEPELVIVDINKF